MEIETSHIYTDQIEKHHIRLAKRWFFFFLHRFETMNFNLCAVKFVQHDVFFSSFFSSCENQSDTMIKLNLTGERLLGGWHTVHLCLFVEKKNWKKINCDKIDAIRDAAILHIEFTFDLTCARFFIIIIIIIYFLQPFKTVTKFCQIWYECNELISFYTAYCQICSSFEQIVWTIQKRYNCHWIAESKGIKKKNEHCCNRKWISIIWCSSFIDEIFFLFCIRFRNISEKYTFQMSINGTSVLFIHIYKFRTNSFFSKCCIVHFLNASSDFLSIQNSSQRSLIIICRCANNIYQLTFATENLFHTIDRPKK